GVFSLRRAQRALVRAAEQVFTSEPDLLAAAFHRDYRPGSYWSFVLLYSARRLLWPGQLLYAGPGEHAPRRRPPAAWPPVWDHATAMDPAQLVPLLVWCRRRQAESGLEDHELPRLLVCPRGWDWLTE